MARGPSGRIIAEIEPEQKRALYAALTADGLTFKDWLMATSSAYLKHRRQPEFFELFNMQDPTEVAAEDPAKYQKRKNTASL